MAKIIEIPTYKDQKGVLSVIDHFPHQIKRIYYIYNASGVRGGHRHKKTIQGLVCVAGSCDIYIHDGKQEDTVILNAPNRLLLLNPSDWHTMQNFSKDCVLLVVSSEHYDRDDYIDEPYK